MKKLTIASLMTILILGMVYFSVGQVPSILPISPVTESIVFQKDVTVEGILYSMGGAGFANLMLVDSGGTHFLTIQWGETDPNDRTLNINVDGGNRILQLEDDAYLDQDYTSDAVPTFQGVKFNDSNATHQMTLDWNENDIADRQLRFKVNSGDRTIDLSGNLTLTGANAVGTWTATTVNATTLDTNVTAAGLTLAGTTLAADGTDTNIGIRLTPKGTGGVGIGIAHVAGTKLTLPQENDAVTPTLAFGDGDTGFYEYIDDEIRVAIGGAVKYAFKASILSSLDGGSWDLRRETASGTNPTLIPSAADGDTGIGWAATDQLSLIAGGVEGIRIAEDTTILVDLKGEVNSVSHYGTMQTATGDGTTTIDWGLGNIVYFTFGAANETFTFTAPANKGKMTLIMKQDGTGSRTATWPATVLWPGNVAPTLSTGANDVDIVTLIYDGTNFFGLFNGDFS